MLNDTEKAVFTKLLRGISQELGNAGSNELYFPNSPEARALEKEVNDLAFGGDEVEGTKPSAKEICFNDSDLLDLLAKRLGIDLEEEIPPRPAPTPPEPPRLGQLRWD